jgi:hypothetical protein
MHKDHIHSLRWSCLIVAVVAVAGLNIIGRAQPPGQGLVPSSDITETWQKVVINDGKVTQAGNQLLMYPIALPKSVTLLGGVALVRGTRGSKQNSETVLELFFPIKDKSAIRQWQTNSVHRFPVLIQGYQILKGPDLHTFNNGWIYRMTVRGEHIDIRLVVSVYTFCPAKLNPGELPDIVGPAWVSPVSPIRNQPSFIGIRVTYIPR